MSKIEYVKNPINFLRETGLLYEINRTILHPLGLAMSVQLPKHEGEETDVGVIQLWDCRNEKEGVLYAEETFMSGLEKYTKFMEEFGENKLNERFEELGYDVQSLPDPYYLKNGVELEAKDKETGESISFRVPPSWLAIKVDEWFGLSLEDFLQAPQGSAYDLMPIYTEAKNDKVVMK